MRYGGEPTLSFAAAVRRREREPLYLSRGEGSTLASEFHTTQREAQDTTHTPAVEGRFPSQPDQC